MAKITQIKIVTQAFNESTHHFEKTVNRKAKQLNANNIACSPVTQSENLTNVAYIYFEVNK